MDRRPFSEASHERLISVIAMRVFTPTALVFFLLTLSACQLPMTGSPSATPTADLSAYYGEPKAAVLIINGQQQRAGVGTSTWITSKSGDGVSMSHGDAFAMVTPNQALVTKSPFTATLESPVPAAPSRLSYSLVATTHLEKQEHPEVGTIAWTPSQPAENPLPLEPRQDIALDLSPGGYVLVVFAEWADLGSVEYGFWIEVQPETLKATPTLEATATSAPTSRPAMETPIPTPDFDKTATAIAQAVVSTAQPKVYASSLSPDKNWRVEIMVSDCVRVGEGDPNVYEQLNLIQISNGVETVIDSQLHYCEGLGAYGFEGLLWSSTSRYFYYTPGREGAPDGLCWYWERPIHRIDVLTQATEFVGAGPLSPDKTKIASWRERDLVIWGLNESELARIPAAISNARLGPISWSPDSRSLVYVQTTSDCFPFGKSNVIRLDVSEQRQSLLLESETPSFIHVTWEAPNRIRLGDEERNQWTYNLVTHELRQAP